MRSSRDGKSPPRSRSVWLKMTRLLKSLSLPPQTLGRYRLRCGSQTAVAGRLRHEEGDALALVLDEALDDHEPDERLAETDAVAEEGAAVLAGDLDERLVALPLVLVEPGEHLGLAVLPLSGGQLVAAEELLQSLGVDLEGSVLAGVAFDDLRGSRV